MIRKLTKKEFMDWSKVVDVFFRMLFGDDYQKLKFTDRVQKAFVQSKDFATITSTFVIIIYGLAYIGYFNLIKVIFALSLGFYILFTMFYMVVEAIFFDDEAQEENN